MILHPIQYFKWRHHYDYSSPGLVNLPCHVESFFPFARRRPSFNIYVPHTAREDRRYPNIGFVSWDEATLLYNYGLRLRGKPVLEIGCWVGFSTVVWALSGAVVTVIDPVLGGAPQGEACRDSLKRAGLLDKVELIPGFSPQTTRNLANQGRKFTAFFVDGDHEGDAPLRDVMACIEAATDDCVILLHDLILPNIAEALAWLCEQGWECGVHYTAQFIGVAWRGGVEVVKHVPDPRVDWSGLVHRRLPHLADFRQI